MQNQRKDMLDYVEYSSIPNFLPLGLASGSNTHPPVEELVDNSSEYYFELASDQITVPENHDGGYEGVLNNKGKLVLENILTRVKSNDFKNIIQQYYLVTVNSGPWFPDKLSPFYKPNLDGSGDLNS